jgi:hypothetical protein
VSFAQYNVEFDEEVYMYNRYDYGLCYPKDLNETTTCATSLASCVPICNYASKNASVCGTQVSPPSPSSCAGELMVIVRLLSQDL